MQKEFAELHEERQVESFKNRQLELAWEMYI